MDGIVGGDDIGISNNGVSIVAMQCWHNNLSNYQFNKMILDVTH